MNKPLNIPFGLKPISEELLSSFQQLENNQLHWLSGYCAGLANSSDQNSNIQTSNVTAEAIAVDLEIIILYGSQTGNSEFLAKQFQSQIIDMPLKLSFQSLEEIKPKELEKYDVILLAISTHGEGEPPDDSIEFLEALQGKRAPKLIDKKHAVLALGDSSYEFFCQTGKDFDKRLIELGSKPILEFPHNTMALIQSFGFWAWLNKEVSVKSTTTNNFINFNLIQYSIYL